jgi:hypothetical protein
MENGRSRNSLHRAARLRPDMLSLLEHFDSRSLYVVQSRDVRHCRRYVLHGTWLAIEGLRQLMSAEASDDASTSAR